MKVIKIIIKFFNDLISVKNLFYNIALFRYNRVSYGSIPKIVGTILISNQGEFIVGQNVTFNSTPKSNFVGLSKKCSIGITQLGILKIGNCSGFSGISIYCSKSITIGNYVNCGGNVSIWDSDFHPLNYEDRRLHKTEKINSKEIVINDDVFIGANSIILKGVTIGARSIIGAGSVVTKDVPVDEIWAGNPAKFIRRITQS